MGAREFFPDAARVIRSSPHSDNIVGYGGPSDVLVGLGADGKIVGIAIRETYDTEKYVGYVRDEYSFMQLFNGKTLEEMAGFDLEANEVEGVSGATMTSLAVRNRWWRWRRRSLLRRSSAR